MDFMNSITHLGLKGGGGGGAFNSVWGKIRVKMTETFIVNTNKHIKMLCTTVILIILICNKIKNYLQKLIHKIVEVFF